MNFYELNILGLKRDLPILKTPSGITIAGFNPVGDINLLKRAGEDLADQLRFSGIKFDIILTTEFKGLPIAQEVARNLNCDYVCLRKDKKCYMLNPKHTNGGSITSGKSDYYICELDLAKLRNKRVVFVDDVFSTGSTLNSMLEFAKTEYFKLVCGLFILKEGSKNDLSFKFNDLPMYCSGFLPLPEQSFNAIHQNYEKEF